MINCLIRPVCQITEGHVVVYVPFHYAATALFLLSTCIQGHIITCYTHSEFYIFYRPLNSQDRIWIHSLRINVYSQRIIISLYKILGLFLLLKTVHKHFAEVDWYIGLSVWTYALIPFVTNLLIPPRNLTSRTHKFKILGSFTVKALPLFADLVF